jgi:Na+-driven multidrug efflux pump
MSDQNNAIPTYKHVAKEYFLELLEVLKIGWPLAVTFVCFEAMQFVDLVFIGHLGNSDFIASAALSTALTNCFIFLVLGSIRALYVKYK